MNPLFFSLGALVGSQTLLRAVVARQPFPMPHQFGKLLDHSLRLQYRKVSETLGLFSFQAGMQVLDLGCGTGTFSEEMARMVGSEGTIHAVDLQQPLLQIAQQRLQASGLGDRVRFHHCGANALPMSAESIDLAILIATFGEIDDKFGALSEIRRVLKPGARLAISEEMLDPAYLSAASVKQWLGEAGFHFIGKSGTPFCYSVIFRK